MLASVPLSLVLVKQPEFRVVNVLVPIAVRVSGGYVPVLAAVKVPACITPPLARGARVDTGEESAAINTVNGKLPVLSFHLGLSCFFVILVP
jgi:hypothetical protein